jgi:magnesium chelatase family protein
MGRKQIRENQMEGIRIAKLKVTYTRISLHERYKGNEVVYANAQISSEQLQEICVINQACSNLLKTAMERLNLSARAYDRILKVSRTIADLAGSPEIKTEHLAEAIQYRSLDRESWGS